MAESKALFLGMSTGTRELLNQISATNTKVAANEGNIAGVSSKASKNEADIATIISRLSKNETDIAALNNQLINFVNSLASADYVVEYKTNEDGSWYRKYRSGWIEQSGVQVWTSRKANIECKFLLPFANTNYYLKLQHFNNPESDYEYSKEAAPNYLVHDVAGSTCQHTTTGFKVSYTPNSQCYHRWYACGQGA